MQFISKLRLIFRQMHALFVFKIYAIHAASRPLSDVIMGPTLLVHATSRANDAIQRELSVRGIQWKMNCPGNPEAGGAWERLVQSIKRVLAVTLHEIAPRVKLLRAMLLEASNIVNSRPLTHLPLDPDATEPIIYCWTR